MPNMRPRDLPKKKVNSASGISNLKSKKQTMYGATPTLADRKIVRDRLKGIGDMFATARRGKAIDRDFLLNEIKKLPKDMRQKLLIELAKI